MTLAHTQAEKRSANMIQATLLLTGGAPQSTVSPGAPSAASAVPAPAPRHMRVDSNGDPSLDTPEEGEYLSEGAAREWSTVD